VAAGTLTSDPDFTLSLSRTNNSVLQIAFSGNQNATLGDLTLNVNAVGYSGAIQSQTHTIHVKSSLAIPSPDTLNGTAGFPVNFVVTATGNPTPSITADPHLNLWGMTLTDHGNGTATISGTPPLSVGNYQCSNINIQTNQTLPCGIIATNSQGSVEQQFTINLNNAPDASLIGPPNANFVAAFITEYCCSPPVR